MVKLTNEYGEFILIKGVHIHQNGIPKSGLWSRYEDEYVGTMGCNLENNPNFKEVNIHEMYYVRLEESPLKED